jgi:hypothetical protein
MFHDKEDRPLKEDRSIDSDKDQDSQQNEPVARKPWQSMRLTYTGEAKDVVMGGSGKFSPAPADPGDPRKPPGNPA